MINHYYKYISVRVIIAFVLMFIFIGHTTAQQIPDNLVLFEGQVLSKDSLLTLPKAHLISKFKKWGSISDKEGRFKMYASKHDSILFTSVGFSPKIIYLGDSVMRKLGEDFKVYMSKDTVMINEVIIRAFYDYETFKQMVISMEPLNLDQFYPDWEGTELLYKDATPKGFTGPVQLMYDWLNKSARLERKLIRNRKAYNELMMQMGGDTIPSIPEHMR